MMDFRQRLDQSRTKLAGSEEPVEHEERTSSPFFATDRAGTHSCLDLRLPDGVRKALPYAYFTEINFDMDAGIEILTTGKRIRIIGRNLTSLFDQLITYRVRFVQANIGSNANEDGLFVKEIRVEDV